MDEGAIGAAQIPRSGRRSMNPREQVESIRHAACDSETAGPRDRVARDGWACDGRQAPPTGDETASARRWSPRELRPGPPPESDFVCSFLPLSTSSAVGLKDFPQCFVQEAQIAGEHVE